MSRAILVFALLAVSTCAGRASVGLTHRALQAESRRAQQASIDARDYQLDRKEGNQR